MNTVIWKVHSEEKLRHSSLQLARRSMAKGLKSKWWPKILKYTTAKVLNLNSKKPAQLNELILGLDRWFETSNLRLIPPVPKGAK